MRIAIRRTYNCPVDAQPSILIILSGGDGPILRYSASSRGEAERYEAETIQALRSEIANLDVIHETPQHCADCQGNRLCKESA